MVPEPILNGLPAAGWRQYDIERRMHELLGADPSLEVGWPDTLWPVLPDRSLSAARAAMGQFAHLNGFVRPVSLQVIEAELTAMVRDLLCVPEAGATTLTVGGTESNFLAVKGALFRSRERALEGRPNMVIAATAHPSFDKAAEELDIEVRRIWADESFRADVAAMEAAVDERTILIAASAPNYTHGVIDPIEEIAALAVARDIWFHVDACVGGCLLPTLQRIRGASWTTPFDFPGVTSVSADLHKFGFTPTGISTLSIASKDLMRYHSFKVDVDNSWPFRPYARTGFAGSRSGAVLAGAWATLVALGKAGYEEIANHLIEGAAVFAKGIDAVPGVEILAPHECGIIIFTSTDPAVSADQLATLLEAEGWPPMLAVKPDRLHFLLSPLDSRLYEAFVAAIASAMSRIRAGETSETAGVTTYGA
jgi:sphinganine-1-phosphate aldolase